MCKENANTIVLERPVRFVSSLDVFADLYDLVHGAFCAREYCGCEPIIKLRNILWHKHSRLTTPARFPQRLQLAVGEEYETFLFKLEKRRRRQKGNRMPEAVYDNT